MTTKKKYQYVVCSKTASSMNNERCWMNIGMDKLKKAVESKGKYWFVCSIEGNTCVYSAVATELQNAFEEYNVVIMGNKHGHSLIFKYYKQTSSSRKNMSLACSSRRGHSFFSDFSRRNAE